MTKIILAGLLIISVSTALAQPIPPRSIEDSVIGWKKVYHLKGAKEPLRFDDKTYSIAQLSLCDTLINWMQASYVPKGGLGDAKKTVVGNVDIYHQGEASLPPSYGAYTKTYTELRYNSSGKMEPVTDGHERWSRARCRGAAWDEQRRDEPSRGDRAIHFAHSARSERNDNLIRAERQSHTGRAVLRH